MSADDVLLEACRCAPEDDAPRLVWADAVGGERGELVVIQCDLARGGLPPAEAAARRRRERELLARHGAEWSGFGAFPPWLEFRRGFVEAVKLDAHLLVDDGDEIFRRAPLLHSLTTDLTVTSGDPLDGLRALIRSPCFWRLHGLDLHEVGIQSLAFDYDPGFDSRGDDAARLLAESGAISHLDALGISTSGLTAAGVHHLVASGELSHLERLWLRGTDCGGDAVIAVLSRAPRLKSLDLFGVSDLETIAPALPPVTELHLSGMGDAALAALGRSRAASTLERLRLTHCSLERDDGFLAFPRLRELDLQASWITEPARALVDAMPALRRLRPSATASSSELLRVGRALGPQLEQLDLRDHREKPGLVESLLAHVAGEVLTYGPDTGWPLL